MMKLLSFLFAGMMFSISAYAKDFGYGATTWGMSPNNVVIAEKGKAKLIDPVKYIDSWGKATADNVKIGGGDFSVSYIFDDANGLIQVNVVSSEKGNKFILGKQFDTLNQLLTQKYGQPQFKNENNASWKTRSTTIELSKRISQRELYPSVLVRYMSNESINSSTSEL